MKRDIIIIEDKAVSVTGNDVWMTATEIAGLFHTTVPAVNAAIKAVRKSTEHLQHLPVPHVAGREGSLTREAADIRDVHTERKNRILLKISNENYTKEFLYGFLSK